MLDFLEDFFPFLDRWGKGNVGRGFGYSLPHREKKQESPLRARARPPASAHLGLIILILVLKLGGKKREKGEKGPHRPMRKREPKKR